MSTIDHIQAALPDLSIEELYRIERCIHDIYRRRDIRIIYDDSYGVWTEEDQASAASEVFALMDGDKGAGTDADT